MAQIQVRDPARAIVLATALLCLFVASSLTAQTPGNGGGDDELVDLIALRLESGATIDMDGRLDEEAWESAIPITDFRQQEPVEGGTPSERTEIRIVYDEDALYIGAMLYDDPEGILAFQKRRDGFLRADDRFMWTLDTFHDLRTGYYFETTATGVMGDGLITGGEVVVAAVEVEVLAVGSSPELCVKVRGSSSMLRLGCLGDLLRFEKREIEVAAFAPDRSSPQSNGGDEAERTGSVGEGAGAPDSTLDLGMQALEAVRGA